VAALLVGGQAPMIGCPLCGAEFLTGRDRTRHLAVRPCYPPSLSSEEIARRKRLKRNRDNETRYLRGERDPGRRHGWTSPRRLSFEERFWEKVDQSAGLFGCWPWRGNRGSTGHGQMRDAEGRIVKAHRIAYELLVGPIPDGLSIDHLCHNADLSCNLGDACPHRGCVNPAHLEAVPIAVNIRRGRAGGKRKAVHSPLVGV
jgi:hypothetical protein